MEGVVHHTSLGLLAALLLYAVVSDVRRRIIPNWLCVGVAALAVPYWLSTGLPLWPLLAVQLGLAAATLLAFALLFARGLMGGGDVKLLAALALWLPLPPLLRLLLVMALAGGALTLAYLLLHRLRRREASPEIPYGCAIVFAAFAVLGEPLVKQLAG